MLLAKQGRRVPIPVFMSMLLLASFIMDDVSPYIWGSWLFFVAIILYVRWYILGRLPELFNITLKNRLRIAVTLSATNGIAHAISLVFFVYFSELERAIQTLILIGLSAGAVATTAGYMPIFLAYLLPTIVPLSIIWIINSTSWVEIYESILILLFGGILITLAKDAFRLFIRSFDIRLQQISLNKILNKTLEKAETANRSKTRFLAAASHDLRQPLHTLSVFGAALNLRPLDSHSKDIVNNMNIALQILANQLDALLDVSKLDAGVVEVNYSVINLHTFLNRMHTEYISLAEEKGIDLTVECKKNIFIKTDEFLYESIVRNLISNAIKYTECGHIKIILETGEINNILKIKDTGYGILKEQQEKVFEEFYQVNNTQSNRGNGLGLGLAIVQRLVKLLDIELDMESSTEHGTTFSLKHDKSEFCATNIIKITPPDLSLNNLKVLIVDDEDQVRLGMNALLDGLGCSVTLACSMSDALTKAKSTKPDIVLTDLHLQGTDDGINTIFSIRKRYPELPAILISGDTSSECFKTAKNANIPLLHKPVLVEDLKVRIIESISITKNNL